jgi:hypothetical protein
MLLRFHEILSAIVVLPYRSSDMLSSRCLESFLLLVAVRGNLKRGHDASRSRCP